MTDSSYCQSYPFRIEKRRTAAMRPIHPIILWGGVSFSRERGSHKYHNKHRLWCSLWWD